MIFRRTLKTWFLMPAFLLTMVSAPATAKVVYVDADAGGTNNGSSWADAYNYLQDALADANSSEKPVEIRVAQGVYRPDEDALHPGGTGDREATFQLISGVCLKGGYAGSDELDPDARDITLYETILSGDLFDDDVDVNDAADLEDEPSRVDNSWHVVTGTGTDETAVLEGFTVASGYAMSAPAQRDGAGLYNESGHPTVADCRFRQNAASAGGAIFNFYSDLTLTNCNFENNYANGQGGAVLNLTSSATLIDCTFCGNVADSWGGAMWSAWHSSLTLNHCTFKSNYAFEGGVLSNETDSVAELVNCTLTDNHDTWGGGGAILNSGSALMLSGCSLTANSAHQVGGAVCNDMWASVTLTHCTLAENNAGVHGGALHNRGMLTATNCVFVRNCQIPWRRPSRIDGGGALYNSDRAKVSLTGCAFEGNTAFTGGAVFNWWGSKGTLTDCHFSHNNATGPPEEADRCAGGAMYNELTLLSLFNCSFSANTTTGRGGAICNDSSTLALTNCTITDNRAGYAGGGMQNSGRSATLTNCICWGNSGSEIEGPAVVTYTDISGGWPGEGNIDADPCFAEPGYWDANGTPDDANDDLWVNGDYHLKSQAGRWDPLSGSWVYDDVTSPCIDAGDMSSPIGLEPFPNGGVINMGAYGSTAEASKSYFGEPVCETIVAADINGDCRVDHIDFALMARNWCRAIPTKLTTPPNVAITEPANGAVIGIHDPNTPIIIRADAIDPDGFVVEVEFLITYSTPNRIRRRGSGDFNGADGWQFEWFWWDLTNPFPEGEYTIVAYAIGDDGRFTPSPEVIITVHGPN